MQCPAHMMIDAINFLTYNFARYRLVLRIQGRLGSKFVT